MPIRSVNPHNLKQTRSFAELSVEEIDSSIDSASDAQVSWKTTDIAHRLTCVSHLASELRINLDAHAHLITEEMGKPIREARAEVLKCANLCDYYIKAAPNALADQTTDFEETLSILRHEPLGIVLAIMPWNFPYWQVFRAAIPVLLSGNAMLLKHASNTTQCAFQIEKSFQKSGFPNHLFKALPVAGKNANTLIKHAKVSAITFTGSNPVGEKIGQLAGEHIKKTVMELGGSDPSLVLADADIQLAVEKCVAGRMLNAGQSCIAAKRIIVHDSLYQSFIERAATVISNLNVGNPMDEKTAIGPLATGAILEGIRRQVSQSVEMGAKQVVGAQSIDREGHYFNPTLLTELTTDMPVWNEETFGPVMCVMPFSTETEAVTLANQTPWGLGCSIYSKNIDHALNIGRKIDSGTCAINDFVKSDPRIPFGGVKKSGYGRELSTQGLLEFTNLKAYNISK